MRQRHWDNEISNVATFYNCLTFCIVRALYRLVAQWVAILGNNNGFYIGNEVREPVL